MEPGFYAHLSVLGPRVLILKPTSRSHPLSLICESVDGGKRASLRFQDSGTFDPELFGRLLPVPVYGIVGTVQFDNDIFLGLVTGVKSVGNLHRPSEEILRVTNVGFFSLLTARFDVMAQQDASTTDDAAAAAAGLNHPCAPLTKLLTQGSFYFSTAFDLTRSAQDRFLRTPSFRASVSPADLSLIDSGDPHFIWNLSMLSELVRLKQNDLEEAEIQAVDLSGMLVPLIQGYVGITNSTLKGQKCKLVVLSRLSCKRAGTRFQARGVDDDGNVSNFVETEMILYYRGAQWSFLQIRGSVPLFWEQVGIQMTHKVTISRGTESTAPAIQKHFEDLIQRYSHVHIVNLLGQKDTSGEFPLSEAYRLAASKLKGMNEAVVFTAFDFHAIVKRDNYERLEDLVSLVTEDMDIYSHFFYDKEKDLTLLQKGIFRTNCLDCLDRTNVVQTCIAKSALLRFLKAQDWVPMFAEENTFWALVNNLWADSGDWSSRIYAGTGALKSAYTRSGKQSLLGFLDDAAKSAARFYINNFQDQGKQEAIDILLGKFQRGESLLRKSVLHEMVYKELHARLGEYSSTKQVNFFLGTWNVNGKYSTTERLDNWLVSGKVTNPQMYVIGIQELIELSPGAYITTDTDKLRQAWETILITAINSRKGEQDCVSAVRHVETARIKTGLGGMAANKGGIGVSLSFYDTRCAFVTAHFAAGKSAVADRNSDYKTISQGLIFRTRTLADHDLIFWLGDFNYRLNAPNEEVRLRVQKKDLDYLLKFDQLLDARAQKLCFEDYYEGQLTFPPTYKYDNGTNTYDTSEKARTPSWTDRVLYKGKNVTLLEYARGDCHISDHKPVRAVFEVKALVMDHPRRAEIRQELFQSQKGMKTAGAPIKPSLPTRPSQKRSDAQITAPIIPSAVSRNIEQPRKPSLPPAPVPALVAATTGTLIDFEDSTPAQTALQQQEPPLGVVGQAMQLISLEDVSKQAPNASANAAVHTSGDGYSSNPALNGSVTQRSGSSHFHQQARGSQQEQQQQSFWWEQQKQQQSQNDSAEQLRRESCRNNPFNEASMTQQHQQQRNSTVALPPWNPLIPTNSGVLSSPVNFVGTPQGTSGSSFISTARTSMSNSSPHNPFFVPTTASINNPPIDIVRGTSLRNSNDPNGNASRHGSLSGSRTGSRPGSLSNVALSSSPHGIDAPRSSGPGKLDPTLLNHFSETG